MKSKWFKEYFSIPNLMGYFRILMLPVFLVLYTGADSRKDYFISFAVLAVSFLTDFFDGRIARRFGMVTEFGKALDPLADKLTQGTLILAVAFRYSLMRLLIILFLLKEGYMLCMRLYLKKKKSFWDGAQWYGKICTAVLDVGLFALLLFWDIPMWAANLIMGVMTVFMLFSLVKYVQFHKSVLSR